MLERIISLFLHVDLVDNLRVNLFQAICRCYLYPDQICRWRNKNSAKSITFERVRDYSARDRTRDVSAVRIRVGSASPSNTIPLSALRRAI